MGNDSNASSETELRSAFGWLIGEEGRGIANILEMVAMTRFYRDAPINSIWEGSGNVQCLDALRAMQKIHRH